MTLVSTGGTPTQYPAVTLVHADGSTYTPPSMGEAQSSEAVSGRYYAGGSNRTTLLSPNGLFRPMVYDIPTCTIDLLFCEVVTIPGSAGSVVRFGIYGSLSTGAIGSLILDAGTAASTATGIVSVSISQILTGGRYFLVAVPQGAPVTNPTLRSAGTEYRYLRGGTTALDAIQNNYPGLGFNNQTGALGAPGATLGMIASLPVCGYRVA